MINIEEYLNIQQWLCFYKQFFYNYYKKFKILADFNKFSKN